MKKFYQLWLITCTAAFLSLGSFNSINAASTTQRPTAKSQSSTSAARGDLKALNITGPAKEVKYSFIDNDCTHTFTFDLQGLCRGRKTEGGKIILSADDPYDFFSIKLANGKTVEINHAIPRGAYFTNWDMRATKYDSQGRPTEFYLDDFSFKVTARYLGNDQHGNWTKMKIVSLDSEWPLDITITRKITYHTSK